MSRGDPQIRVRLDSGLKERIMLEARSNSRTFTAEVNARLLNSLENQGQTFDSRDETLNSILLSISEIKDRLDFISNHLSLEGVSKGEGSSE